MPLLVSHDERRDQAIAAASAILARSGLRAVTVRAVAREAGFSTAVVSHYFRDKQEMLHLVFERNTQSALEAADVALERTGALKAFIEPSMVLTQESADRWRIWLAYIAQVVSEADGSALQHDSVIDRVARLAEVLEAFKAQGDLQPDLDCRLEAQRLLAVMVGLAIQVMFDPEGWPNARQHALVDVELRGLFVPDRIPASLSPSMTAG